MEENRISKIVEEHKIIINYDELMSALNFVSNLNEILNRHGIKLEIEDVEHDGYDVCIVKIEK